MDRLKSIIPLWPPPIWFFMPLGLWALLWLGLQAGPIEEIVRSGGPETFIHRLRSVLPLWAAYMAVVIFVVKFYRQRSNGISLFGPLGFVTAYGVVGIAASLLSPDGSVALYWAAAYLSVPLVLWGIVWGKGRAGRRSSCCQSQLAHRHFGGCRTIHCRTAIPRLGRADPNAIVMVRLPAQRRLDGELLARFEFGTAQAHRSRTLCRHRRDNRLGRIVAPAVAVFVGRNTVGLSYTASDQRGQRVFLGICCRGRSGGPFSWRQENGGGRSSRPAGTGAYSLVHRRLPAVL